MIINQIVEQSKASIEKEDLRILLNITVPMKPKRILEIGSWKTYSTEVWYNAFNPDVLIGLEKEIGISDGEWTHFVLNTQLVNIFEGCDSHDPIVFESLKQYKFDFLFIDGDHSLDGVIRDWKMYSLLVEKGGLVVFHDCIYTSDDPLAPVQVKPLWDDLKKSYPYVEIKTTERSTGMGVLFI